MQFKWDALKGSVYAYAYAYVYYKSVLYDWMLTANIHIMSNWTQVCFK